MTETSHTRSRIAAIFGLVLQLLAFAALLALARSCNSWGMHSLAWFVLGGVPIWFAAVLVFRQRELAALEALDLEELRREKEATGAAGAMFDAEGGGGLGFRVAQARLAWMLKWLVPTFSLVTAAYLAATGYYAWHGVASLQMKVDALEWPVLEHTPVALIVIALLMLLMFLYSRYTSGLARGEGWQLLRGCGSYMLGNALAAGVLLIGLGIYQYSRYALIERYLAYAIPIVMALLSVEFVLNFVLDVYRPRKADQEARAAFDSRLLGLFAEPGGIAHTIAEAINYQFGFQVSQTWLYQLMQRAFIPLIAAGAAVLWLMTTILIVRPHEHALIERLGRQIDASKPLGPGLYFKLPWPIDVARIYNTGQVHEFIVGFKTYNAVRSDDHGETPRAEQWTDEQHFGQPHFDFVVLPSKTPGAASAPAESDQDAATAVHLIRLAAVVQYRLRADALDQFTQRVAGPEDALRQVAWEEVSRFCASQDVDSLLGQKRDEFGPLLRERLARRVDELGLGLEIIYVGLDNIHPEKAVAEAYRGVVAAELESVATVRSALVSENETLSHVAGSRRNARAVVAAINASREVVTARNDADRKLGGADAGAIRELEGRLAPHTALYEAYAAATLAQRTAEAERDSIRLDTQHGIDRRASEIEAAERSAAEADAAVKSAREALDAAIAPIRADAAARLGAERGAALLARHESNRLEAFWTSRLETLLKSVEGQAAALLASASADRWGIEMQEAGNLAVLKNEIEAYRANPRVYRIRRLTETLVDSLASARKVFQAFDPQGRKVKVRFNVADDTSPTSDQLLPAGRP